MRRSSKKTRQHEPAFLPALRDAGTLAVLSFLVAFFASLVNRLVFGFGHLTPWLILDYSFEAIIALSAYAFVPSRWRLLVLQALFGIAFRSANSIKVRHLGLPLTASDVFLVNDLYRLLPGFVRVLALGAMAGIAVVTLALIVPVLRWPQKRARWLYLAPAVAILGWIGIAPHTFSAWVDSLTSNPKAPFLLTERQETIGVPLAFSVEAARYLELRRSIPGARDVEDALAYFHSGAAAKPGAPDAAPAKSPNVYILLTETFWDPVTTLRDQGVGFLSPEFRWLWNSNGHRWMLSPMYGGGTANVEFELLCGIPSRTVTRGIVFEEGLSNPMDCLPRMLRDRGYHAYAFHPFTRNFYHRDRAFPLLGFEHYYAIDELAPGSPDGAFLDDETFLDQSIAIARKQAGGAPFLAYFMTFAGHWPYLWIDRLYKKEVSLSGQMQADDLEMVERHFNINLYTSRVLTRTIRKIQQDDPTALIVVTGDHQPGFSGDLDRVPREHDDVEELRFFRTPLVIIGPSLNGASPGALPEYATYEIGKVLLDRLGFSGDEERQFQWFQRNGRIEPYRPVPGGAILVARRAPDATGSTSGGSDPKTSELICRGTSPEPECHQALDWFRHARVLAVDLTHGQGWAAEKHH